MGRHRGRARPAGPAPARDPRRAEPVVAGREGDPAGEGDPAHARAARGERSARRARGVDRAGELPRRDVRERAAAHGLGRDPAPRGAAPAGAGAGPGGPGAARLLLRPLPRAVRRDGARLVPPARGCRRRPGAHAARSDRVVARRQVRLQPRERGARARARARRAHAARRAARAVERARRALPARRRADRPRPLLGDLLQHRLAAAARAAHDPRADEADLHCARPGDPRAASRRRACSRTATASIASTSSCRWCCSRSRGQSIHSACGPSASSRSQPWRSPA